MANLEDIKLAAASEDGGQTPQESMIKQLNEWGRKLSTEDRTKIYKDASGVERIMLGQDGVNPDFIGMKVSKPGIDVVGATNDQLVFNSDNNVFKIVQTGTMTINYAADTFTTETVVHNLGYTPAALVYLESAGTYTVLPTYQTLTLDTVNNVIRLGGWYDWQVNSTDLWVTVSNANGTPGTVNIKYYLLQETAN